MKSNFLPIVLVAALAIPVAAHAQGTVRGAEEGAAVGERDAARSEQLLEERLVQ